LRYSQKTIYNMAAVHHIGFVVTSSYCIRVLSIVFLTLCAIFISIDLVLSDIFGLSCFIIFGWKLPIPDHIFTVLGGK